MTDSDRVGELAERLKVLNAEVSARGPRPGFAAAALREGRRRARRRRGMRLWVCSAGAVATVAASLALWLIQPSARIAIPAAGTMPRAQTPLTADGSSSELRPLLPDAELAIALLELSQVEGSLSRSADWDRLLAPIAPTRGHR